MSTPLLATIAPEHEAAAKQIVEALTRMARAQYLPLTIKVKTSDTPGVSTFATRYATVAVLRSGNAPDVRAPASAMSAQADDVDAVAMLAEHVAEALGLNEPSL